MDDNTMSWDEHSGGEAGFRRDTKGSVLALLTFS